MTNKIKSLIVPLVFSLTLGLMPYFPEPHIWGKLKWLVGGANGMQAMDYFDTILHGFPWLWLVVKIVFLLKK